MAGSGFRFVHFWAKALVILTISFYFLAEAVDPLLLPSTETRLKPTSSSNETTNNGTEAVNSTESITTVEPEKPAELPPEGSEEEEHKSSMAIFFILFIIVLSILLVHVLIVTKFHYMPESLAIVVLGALIGFVLSYSKSDWSEIEAFSPNAFFLILLPPIIFESGYNLHKGNFFANIGSILLFAIVGTAISSIVVGSGIFILGQADLVYQLSAVESYAFGSMISAVDPVATLAIFQSLSVDPLLYMMVFGESVLNDAVAIVLATTVMELNEPSMKNLSAIGSLFASIERFLLVFFGSAVLGAAAALTSALLFKHIDLRKTPALEFGIMLIFSYLPYGLAEGLHLSGIMAILFCGIVMSHYTHFNLSPMTQITMQQTFRTLAFMAETCVFAYLGLAMFTYPLEFKPVLIIWGIVLCLVGRAVNIFPLCYLVNYFREVKITRQMQFVMWFSGLRGAVAFALSLHMPFESDKNRQIMVATTLCIVLFTTMALGGATMPLMKLLSKWQSEKPVETPKKRKSKRRRKRGSRKRNGKKKVGWSLSKTEEMNPVLEPDYSYSEYTETDEASSSRRETETSNGQPPLLTSFQSRLKGIAQMDAMYFRPFFVRKFTQQEKKESTLKLTDLALKWYQNVQQQSESETETSLSNIKTRPENTPNTHTPLPNNTTSVNVNFNNVDLSSSDDENSDRPLI